jgi:DNA-binding NtrC family response regulator
MDRNEHLDGTRSLNDVALETYGQSLSSRFQMRLIEQARRGHFGVLRSRNPQMRHSFEKLAMLVAHRSTPLFIFGERGTGKRRLVHEFYSLQSFLDRLDEKPLGRLKVLRGDYLQPGFRDDFSKVFGSGDYVYIESVETMSLEVQKEMLDLLVSGSFNYRLILGTSVALSLQVVNEKFLKELFTEISKVSVYLPTLIDRSEDLTQLMGEFIEAMSANKLLPPSRILDMLSRADMPQNLDDLETLIRCMLAVKYDPSTWTIEDFPPAFRAVFPQHLFFPGQGKQTLIMKRRDITAIQRALVESGGDHAQAARLMSMSRVEFLQKMLSLGLS